MGGKIGIHIQSGNELLGSCWWANVCQKLDKQLQADGPKDVNDY